MTALPALDREESGTISEHSFRRRRHRLTSAPKLSSSSFDDVRFYNRSAQLSLSSIRSKAPQKHGTRICRKAIWAIVRASKAVISPSIPIDSGQDLRTEMVSVIKQMGVEVEKHHHEVASRAA